ncbi:hypothetical protein DPMN_161943 [Dreissena polymorpha]|uniref:Uncharacterized protein n=1 Tax=Dreissena polymorpha TaxID=45954 RepID=A0A9D4ITV1_DREPO|nr:hypothetical protein DPMN_161943 [Dreissena polymorpha]
MSTCILGRNLTTFLKKNPEDIPPSPRPVWLYSSATGDRSPVWLLSSANVLKLKKESGVVVQFCNCRYSPAWLFSSATADRVRCDCSVLQLQIESGVLVQFCNCG